MGATLGDPQAPYLFESEPRERKTIVRWFPIFGGYLLAQLGITGHWWCGLCLPRQGILGQAGLEGDVDIVAGSLGFALTPEELALRVERKRQELADWHPSWPYTFAVQEAALEGHVDWPPGVSRLVACEVKVSWFDREANPDRAWRRSHRRKGSQVIGQLRLLKERGLARIGFLHIAVTRPLSGAPGLNPWLGGASEAFDVRDSFPQVFDPSSIPWCGYFRALVQPVTGGTEDKRGVGGIPQQIQSAEVLLANPPCATNSFSPLREALRQCARPLTPSTFVLACPRCQRWWTTPELSASACPACGAAWEEG